MSEVIVNEKELSQPTEVDLNTLGLFTKKGEGKDWIRMVVDVDREACAVKMVLIRTAGGFTEFCTTSISSFYEGYTPWYGEISIEHKP